MRLGVLEMVGVCSSTSSTRHKHRKGKSSVHMNKHGKIWYKSKWGHHLVTCAKFRNISTINLFIRPWARTVGRSLKASYSKHANINAITTVYKTLYPSRCLTQISCGSSIFVGIVDLIFPCLSEKPTYEDGCNVISLISSHCSPTCVGRCQDISHLLAWPRFDELRPAVI